MSGWPDPQRLSEGVPVDDILPRIIGNIKRHQAEVIQIFLPDVLSAVEGPPIMFQDLFPLRRRHDGHAGVYSRVNFQGIPSTTDGHSICGLVRGKRRSARRT